MTTPPPSTPSQIVHVVVWTTAVLVLSFFGTLVAMQFQHVTPDEKVFEAFKTAGTGAMSFFFGMLVNTRVTKPDDSTVATTTATENSTEVTKIETKPAPIKE